MKICKNGLSLFLLLSALSSTVQGDDQSPPEGPEAGSETQVEVNFGRVTSRKMPSFELSTRNLPFPLPLDPGIERSKIIEGEQLRASFKMIKQYELKDYVYKNTTMIKTGNTIENLKYLIDREYRLEVVVEDAMVEFDLGYFDEKSGHYYIRNIFNITLMEKDNILFYEVEKLSDDYVKLEEGDDHVLIQWGSAHRKSKIDFREPMPGEISRQMIAFMAVICLIAFLVSRLQIMLMHKQGYMSLAKKEEGAETTIGSPRNSNEKVEVGGWRMIKNDVFIPPKFRGVLSSLVGNGFHLLAIVVVECLSQFIGVFDKYGDGSLINAAVYYCPAMMINGFISSHVYKTMRGEEWGSLMFLSGFFFSVPFFVCIFVFTVLQIIYECIPTIHYSTLLLLIGYSCITCPLAVVGSMGSNISLKFEKIQFKSKTPSIRKRNPNLSYFDSPLFLLTISGILPFTILSFFIDYIFDEFWDQTNDDNLLYVRLLICTLFFVSVTASNSTFFTCVSLNKEITQWTWLSFGYGSSVGFYVFFYSIVYYAQSEMQGVPQFILFSIASIQISVVVALIGGALGFLFSYFRVKKLYNHIKIN